MSPSNVVDELPIWLGGSWSHETEKWRDGEEVPIRKRTPRETIAADFSPSRYYNHEAESHERAQHGGQTKFIAIDLRGVLILVAYYYENCSGKAFVLFARDGKLWEVNGGHCSCNGLEDQWEPEETSPEALRLRMQKGALGDEEYTPDGDTHDPCGTAVERVLQWWEKLLAEGRNPVAAYLLSLARRAESKDGDDLAERMLREALADASPDDLVALDAMLEGDVHARG